MTFPIWFQSFLQRLGWMPPQYRRRQRPQRLATRVQVLEERILMFGLTDDAYMMEMNAVPAMVRVLANDNSSAGPLEVISHGEPHDGMGQWVPGGTFTLVDNPDGSGTHRLVFTPAHDFVGNFSFSYTAQDDSGNQATANVAIEVGSGSGTGSSSGSGYSSGAATTSSSAGTPPTPRTAFCQLLRCRGKS